MARHSIPLDLDIRDPNFPIRSFLWADGARREMKEVIANTKREIATSQALLEKIDRVLARR